MSYFNEGNRYLTDVNDHESYLKHLDTEAMQTTERLGKIDAIYTTTKGTPQVLETGEQIITFVIEQHFHFNGVSIELPSIQGMTILELYEKLKEENSFITRNIVEMDSYLRTLAGFIASQNNNVPKDLIVSKIATETMEIFLEYSDIYKSQYPNSKPKYVFYIGSDYILSLLI